jgi:hypothetical protein
MSIVDVVKKHVKEREAEGYDTYLEHVCQYGCQSGAVSELIYYTETRKFYKEHKHEINQILSEMIEDTGLSVSELFGDNWDNSDPLARDTRNQNLLAWFGYETVAGRLLR